MPLDIVCGDLNWCKGLRNSWFCVCVVKKEYKNMYTYAGAYSGTYMGVSSGVGGISSGGMTPPAAHHQIPSAVPLATSPSAPAAHSIPSNIATNTSKRRWVRDLNNFWEWNRIYQIIRLYWRRKVSLFFCLVIWKFNYSSIGLMNGNSWEFILIYIHLAYCNKLYYYSP